MIEVSASSALLSAAVDAVAESYEGKKDVHHHHRAEFARLCRAAQWSYGPNPIKATITTASEESAGVMKRCTITITLEQA